MSEELLENMELPEIDYSSRSMEEILDDMLRAVPEMTPEWTDLNDNDLGVVILKLMSMVADVLHFYVDEQAKEGLIDTAKLRMNVQSLLSLIDYDMAGPVPARADVKFSLGEPLDFDLPISKGHELETAALEDEDPIPFETTEDLIIPEGGTEGTVGVIQARTQEPIELVSDGRPNMRIDIEDEKVIEQEVKLFVDDGGGYEEWEQVPTLINALPDDEVFVLRRVEDNLWQVQAGDNSRGKKVPKNAAARVVYKVGGGSVGNVGHGVITELVEPVTAFGEAQPVEVYNTEPARGGSDPETIEEAKRNGPLNIRSLNRAVVSEDFVFFAQEFDGVLDAGANYNDEWREVTLTIIPDGGPPVSQELEDSLIDYFDNERPKIEGIGMQIESGSLIETMIEGTIYVRETSLVEDTEIRVEDRIEEYFQMGRNLRLGGNVNLSDIYRMIDNIQGVSHVDLDIMSLDPLSTLDLTFSGDDKFQYITPLEEAIEERWTVTYTTETEFSVSGSESGIQDNTGVVGDIYTSDNNEIEFLVESGGTSPNSPGDEAAFEVTERLANIPVGQKEMMVLSDRVNFDFIDLGEQ